MKIIKPFRSQLSGILCSVKNMKIYFLTAFLVTAVNAGSQNNIKSEPSEKSYFNLTSISIVTGVPGDNDNFKTAAVIPSITMVNGCVFNNRFSIGLGVGEEVYKYAVFPVFADFRYRFHRGDYHPFIALKGGYAFADSHSKLYNYYSNTKFNNKGGWMLNPEVGAYFPIGKKIDLAVSLGYRLQDLESHIEIPSYSSSGKPITKSENIKTTLNRLSFGIGFQFR